MEFQKWLWQEEKQVVSFDFDGILHSSIIPGTTHPCNYDGWDTWEPNEEMHRKVVEEAKTNKIIVVSKRDRDMEDHMWWFIRRFPQLKSIEEIHCTDNTPKLRYLKKLKVIRHYDDDKSMVPEMQNSGIEFILVNVKSSGCSEEDYDYWK